MDPIKNFIHKLLHGIAIICVPFGLESAGMFFFHDTAIAWFIAFVGSVAIAWSVMAKRDERAKRRADEIIASFKKHREGLKADDENAYFEFYNDIRRSVNDHTL